MINNQLTIAKRYAHAFLNVFPLTYSDIENMSHGINFLRQHPQIITFLKIPLLDSSVKLEALKESIIKKFDLSPAFEILVEVLIRKKRSELLLPVLEQVKSYYQLQHNIKLFSISSSTELNESQKKVLQQFLIDQTGATITAIYDIDKKLIAGLRMQNDELQWERSIAQQLKRIRASLIG